MKFSQSYLLYSAVISTVYAAALPAPEVNHDRDGHYTIYRHPNGTTQHVKYANLTDVDISNSIAKRSNLTARSVNWPPSSAIVCQQNWLWNQDLWDWPYPALVSNCQDGGYTFKPYWNYDEYWVSGGYTLRANAVAYFCAFAAEPCHTEEILEAFEWIISACKGGTGGWQTAGYLDIPDRYWNKRYGMTHPDQAQYICTDRLAGPPTRWNSSAIPTHMASVRAR